MRRLGRSLGANGAAAPLVTYHPAPHTIKSVEAFAMALTGKIAKASCASVCSPKACESGD
jgi:hypothetical protein